MKSSRKPILIRMNLANRDQVQFKVRPKNGGFHFNGDDKKYMVVESKIRRFKGKPLLEYVEGNAEPVDPYGSESIVSPEDYNEATENQFIRQVYQHLKTNIVQGLQWAIIACVVLAVVINFYFGNETKDQVEALRMQLAAAHPPPPTVPPPR